MSTLGITTTQNVVIEVESASVLHRAGAWAVDGFILIVGLIFLSFVVYATNNVVSDDFYPWAFYLLLWIFYPLLFESMMEGQTPGKRLMGIKVTMLDGSRPTFGAYFMRWLIGLFEIGFTTGALAFLVVLFSKYSQRLGDMAAGTTVVRVKPAVSLSTLMMEVDVDRTKAPYPEAMNLTDTEVQVLRDVLLARQRGMSSQRAMELLYDAVGIVERKLGVKNSTLPESFLAEVIRSYGIMHAR